MHFVRIVCLELSPYHISFLWQRNNFENYGNEMRAEENDSLGWNWFDEFKHLKFVCTCNGKSNMFLFINRVERNIWLCCNFSVSRASDNFKLVEWRLLNYILFNVVPEFSDSRSKTHCKLVFQQQQQGK